MIAKRLPRICARILVEMMETIKGKTPRKGREYKAAFTFDAELRLQTVLVEPESGKSRYYSRQDILDIVTFIREANGPVALWNASQESETLERFLQNRGEQLPLCGCLADLLEKMNLACIQDTTGGHVGIREL